LVKKTKNLGLWNPFQLPWLPDNSLMYYFYSFWHSYSNLRYGRAAPRQKYL